jgi:mannitol-specific phosphotransferase system IIBC component
MFGGILSSLGLEEAGELVSGMGQAFVLLGTAMSLIPPIIAMINAGLLTPPLGIILGILAAVIISLTIIFSLIKKNSPEAKLQKAAEAAEAAAEAADQAAEAYENLNESINSLGDQYKALEDLTRGT